MVRNDNPITPSLKRQFRIVHVLDSLEDNGAVPVLPQERKLVPCVRFAGEDVRDPGS